MSSNDMDMDENSDWPLVEVEGEQGAQTSLDVIPLLAAELADDWFQGLSQG